MIALDKDLFREVFSLKRSGLTNKEIGVRYGHTSGWTQNILSKGASLGLLPKGDIHVKQLHLQKKKRTKDLTKTLACRAAQLSAEGKSDIDIAEIFGFSIRYIGILLKRGEAEGWFVSERHERIRRLEQEILDLFPESHSFSHLISLVGEKHYHRAKSLLEKYGLYDSLKQRYNEYREENKQTLETFYYKRYCELVEHLGYHPGSKVIRSYDQKLFHWIFREHLSITAYRLKYSIKNSSVVYKKSRPTSRMGNKKLFGKLHLRITTKETKTLANGCASLNEFSHLILCSPTSSRLLLLRYGLYDAFRARIGTVQGKSFKGPLPSLSARKKAEKLALVIQQRSDKFREVKSSPRS